MAALYWRRPTKDAAAEIGCVPEDYVEPEVEVWEENWTAIQLFTRFSTQWRMGPGGPAGLDYGVIQHELSRLHISDDDYTATMDRLRVIEQAALDQIHKNRKD